MQKMLTDVWVLGLITTALWSRWRLDGDPILKYFLFTFYKWAIYSSCLLIFCVLK